MGEVMHEDNSNKKSVIENLNKQIDSINQEIQKLSNSNTLKLQNFIHNFKEELDLISKEDGEIIVDNESQDTSIENKSTIDSNINAINTNKDINQNSISNTNPRAVNNNRNDILKDIRYKLENLDDIIKKTKEAKTKNEAETQDNISNDDIKDSMPQDIKENENTQSDGDLPCDIRTQELSSSNKEKSNVDSVDSNTDIKKEDNTVTIGKFDELIKTDPTNFKHYMERANLYIKRNSYDKAESDYKKAQELTQSKDISVLLALVDLYILNGDSKKILPLYDRALEINPSNVDVLQGRATYYLNLNKDDEFLENIEKAISLDENNAKSYAIRAEYNASKEYYRKALDDVSKVIQLRPDNISAKYFRGVMLYNLEKYDECYDDMKQTLELKISESENEIYKYIGVCSFKLNKFEEAQKYLDKAVEVGVRDEIVFYYRSQTEYEIGNFDAALRDVSKIVDMNSKEYKYYLLRARVCDKKGFFDQAGKDYEKAYKLESSLNILVEKAEFLIKHEKYKQALQDYTLAISLDATKADFYKQRSYIYEKLGKSAKSKEDMEKALSINPSLLGSVESLHKQEQEVDNNKTLKATTNQDQEAQAVEQHLEVTSVSLLQKSEKLIQESKPVVEPRSEQLTQTSHNASQILESEIEPEKGSKSDVISQQTSQEQSQVSDDNKVEQGDIKKQDSYINVQQSIDQTKVESIQERDSPQISQQGQDPVVDSKPISEPTPNESVVSTPQPGLNTDILFNRANINYKNKKFDMALKDIESILAQDQVYVKAYTLRAEIYHQLQDTDKELQDLNMSIKLVPNVLFPYLRRAEIYVLQGKEDLAFSDFSKILELNPKNAGGYLGLARIYVKRGQKDKALENYNNAKKYDLKSIKIIDQEIRDLS
jgi:tetratricopeptide (TPR) repeat protein